MKNVFFLIFLFVLSAIAPDFSVNARNLNDNLFKNFEITASQNSTEPSSQIKDIQVFGERSGIAFTRDTLFRTDDSGATWREIVLPKVSSETISAVSFINENVGWAVLADARSARLEIAKTIDGGGSWTRTPVNLRREDLQEADWENVILGFHNQDRWQLILRRPTTSNFTGKSFYESRNEGQTWEFTETSISLNTSDSPTEKTSANWILKSEGSCEGFKTGCYSESRIIRGGTTEITPPQIVNLARREKENARLEARNSVFAAPPGGLTRISLNRGFDKCTAATVGQMQT